MKFQCNNPTCTAEFDDPLAVDRPSLAAALYARGWIAHIRNGGLDWVLICRRCQLQGFEPMTW